jgi:creatinine amidohydrolase/Fe(II)-dependent formamide hydrolase-like protein
VSCAEKHGGVVYPPVYFPHAVHNPTSDRLVRADRGWKLAMVNALFQSLRMTGFRVIMGVSGHDVGTQITLIEEALRPVTADGRVRGVGLWEISLTGTPESDTDHAAKWETSSMMHYYPEQVDLSVLGDGPLAPDMAPPDGIGGLDPRVHASAAVGLRSAELAADAIGRKARELLESLAPGDRSFGIPGVTPEHWWLV